LKKRHDPCVFLLDDCFDSASVAERLTSSGFTIERFNKHFPRSDGSEKREQSVKDPRVITLCQKHGFLLFTTDRSMKETHEEDIRKTEIGVVATASNQDHTEVWTTAFRKS
jgi:hypothetical protein